jgi:IS30 family transposase
MGPSGLTEKRERYVQLMQQGHSNSEACRILEIHRNTGDRWLNGRKGVGALSREMLYPPRVVVPVRTMSARYLSEDERVFIADRLLGRASLRSIARELGRSPSTISRELARNPPGTGRYHPFRAQKAALRRVGRPRLPKLMADRELHDFVVERLARRWSPQQVCRALKDQFPNEPGRHLVHETIYRALYRLMIRPVPAGNAALLRTGRARRRPRALTRAKAHPYIHDAMKIRDRPAHIASRLEAGHWEGDLVMGKLNKSAVLTLVERSSRILMAFPLASGNRSDRLRDRVIEALGPLPASLRRTLTWDRGAEMAKHAGITAALGTQVYFCDPASPWQRGSNENANGLLRQYFPKGLDLNTVDAADLRRAVDEINHRPRAVLGWASAATTFASLQAAAALQLASVSAPTGSLPSQVPSVLLPTNGDNPQKLSTAPAATGATPTAPNSAVDNPD